MRRCAGKPDFSYFNPRSPHGERLGIFWNLAIAVSISIHAPRTGSDYTFRCWLLRLGIFQSTLPARGATPRDGMGNPAGQRISIHAPRTGSDRESPAHGAGLHYFNPRSPHGERPSSQPEHASGQQFQSTLPARGATRYHFFRRLSNVISIHAPRTGSD